MNFGMLIIEIPDMKALIPGNWDIDNRPIYIPLIAANTLASHFEFGTSKVTIINQPTNHSLLYEISVRSVGSTDSISGHPNLILGRPEYSSPLFSE